MTPVTIDLETFWSVTHSLSKMPAIAYCTHPETEVISLAYKFGDDKTHCIFGEDKILAWAKSVDWSDKMVIGHNLSGFDSMILAWRFGIKPQMWACTLAMSRPWHMKDVGGSLAKLVAHYGLGVKDQSALIQTKGRHLKDFTPEEIDAMRTYNMMDVDQCWQLFKIFFKQTPKTEMKLIDMTVRMLVEPQFEVDVPLLETTLTEERARKHKMLIDLATTVGAWEPGMADEEVADVVSKTLGSAPKFTRLLKDLGVDVPTKISPTTGKEAPALAKTDEGFIALQNHDNPLIAAAAQARLGVKSTILETRIEAFLSAAGATGGKLPVPLKYYGGHTSRWSGEQYNLQSLMRVDPNNPKPSDALRNCLMAGPGKKIVVADLSGIELRVNHFLWQVPSSTALFQADPAKADLYKAFASRLYNVDVSEVSKNQRQIGKVCLAEGTLILCKHVSTLFWCRIEDFSTEYQLWDGKEWVWAKGVVSNGWKKTQQLCGISLTPDHLVLCGTTWQEAKSVHGEKVALALATGAENLSLQDMLSVLKVASLHLSLSAIVGFLSTQFQRKISRISKQLGATFAQRKQQVGNATGSTSKQCRKTTTVADCLTGYQQQLHAATTHVMRLTTTTVGGVSTFVKSGVLTVLRFFDTQGLCQDGIPLSSKWIGSMSTGVTTTATFGLSADEKTCSTNGVCKTSKPKLLSLKHVYDILNCGPRNRFTVLTNKGPMVVHNCHLGLGFSAGYKTFVKIAKVMGGVEITEDESRTIVTAWRDDYPEIVAGWRQSQSALKYARGGREFAIDPWGMCVTYKDGIKTPKGFIYYPDLRQKAVENGDRMAWVCGEGRNLTFLSGGKVDENLVQHLARHVISDAMLEMRKQTGKSPCLSVHDELIYIVDEDEAEDTLDTLQAIMRTPPVWWPELITWSEGGYGDRYGAIK